jgi:8-oxo-dGTP pyrophosphatase MutT (NUDIX family)
MKTERACGCIPFMRTRERELVACMILRPGGYWEFPKGKQEEGETDEETALRELKEETGLEGHIGPEGPIDITYVFTRDDEEVHKEVRYFVCRVPDGSQVVPEKGEVNDHTWLPLEDLMDRATYPEMKEAARRAWQLLAD